MTDNYRDLTLGQQLRIAEIEKAGGDELDVQTAILSVLDGRPPRELMTLPLAEYAALSAKKKFLDYPFPPGNPRTIQKAGKLHLKPTADFRSLNVAQLVDFQELCKRTDDRAIVDLLAVFYVPDGCTYGETDPSKGGYDIDEVKAAILEIPAPDAVAAYAFFLKKFGRSFRRTLSSFRFRKNVVTMSPDMMALRRRFQQILSPQSGDGSTQ